MNARRRFSEAERKKIFAKTEGRCHLCHRTLRFSSYGKPGTTGAWEIDHSTPRSLEGTDRIQNLFPACVSCNRSKQACSSRAVRAAEGYSRSPYSPTEKEQIRRRAGIIGGITGGLIASLFSVSPIPVIVATVGGYKIGRHAARNPSVARKKRKAR